MTSSRFGSSQTPNPSDISAQPTHASAPAPKRAGRHVASVNVAGAGKAELSRRIPLSRIGNGLEERVDANAQERNALAKRFGLVDLEALACVFDLKRAGDDVVMAEGTLRARAVQSCIITGEPVPEEISERFTLRFLPRDVMPDDGDLDLEALLAEEADDVPYEGNAIDIGEAAAEQLSLCLDPYPRKAGSGLESFVEVTPVEEEESAEKSGRPNPFAALKKLQIDKRDKQTDKDDS